MSEEQQHVETESTQENGNGMKKNVISIVIAAVIIVVALQLSGTINLLGSPTVATVNGEKITQAEFDIRLGQILSSPQAQALNLTDPLLREQVESQVLTEIINTRLLLQASIKAGSATDEEAIQEEYNAIVARFGSEELLLEELKNGNITKSQFMDNVRDQIIIQQYLDDSINEADVVVTQEEIKEFYDQVSVGQEDVPALEELQAQIESQLVIQKEQEQISSVILALREESDIVILRNAQEVELDEAPLDEEESLDGEGGEVLEDTTSDTEDSEMVE